MEARIQIRVEGSLVSGITIEKVEGHWGVVIQDPIYGSFSASGMKLEISQDGSRWYSVTEHELVALLVT